MGASTIVGKGGSAGSAERAWRARWVQRWLDLTFLHAAYDPRVVKPLIPRGLELDTHPDCNGREKAWVGLVGFRIAGTRPPWGPPLPLLSSFPELNVRTYVRRDGFDPAVLFLTLDAPNRFACAMGRILYKVPYLLAATEHARQGGFLHSSSVRNGSLPARTEFRAALGEAIAGERGSLEEFLTNRSRFFALWRGVLLTASVRHPPYRLRALRVERIESGHFQALGLPPPEWAHACYCEGVRSEFSRPAIVDEGDAALHPAEPA